MISRVGIHPNSVTVTYADMDLLNNLSEPVSHLLMTIPNPRKGSHQISMQMSLKLIIITNTCELVFLVLLPLFIRR